MNVSGFIRQLLLERMGRQVGYAGAMSRYPSRTGSDLSEGGRHPAREELHDRTGLR